jgi:hypothetical protein
MNIIPNFHTTNNNNFSLYSNPPFSKEEFGHYLAGLIDGDGHFSKNQLVIVFSTPDLFLAEYLKVRLGSGNIYKIENKNAYKLVICKKGALADIIDMVNGKIRKLSKLNQINNNVIHNKLTAPCGEPLSLNTNEDLNNYWLAGFSDADASFQIKILQREKRLEIRLNFQVDQKERILLDLIKNKFGGHIGYRETQDTYYYGSISFKSASNVINYFDKYNLLSGKYLNYQKWKKVHKLIEKKLHLTDAGIQEIIAIKNTMNSRKGAYVKYPFTAS